MSKCYWCGQGCAVGVHKSCWRDLTSFALSARPLPDLVNDPRLINDLELKKSLQEVNTKDLDM